MKRRRVVTVLGPLAVALAALAARQLLRPPAPTRVVEPARSIALPLPASPSAPRPGARFELHQAGSAARFEASGLRGVVAARTDQIEGELVYDERGRATELRWAIDLRGLEPEDDAGAATFDRQLRHLLGLSIGETLRFVGRAEWATTDYRFGLQQIRWIGRLELGGRPNVLPMDLWLAPAGVGRVRVQGVGTIDSSVLPLPRRYFLGVLPETYRITLGLDLEFRPLPE